MIRMYLLAGAAAPCLLLSVPIEAQTLNGPSGERSDSMIIVTGQRDQLKLNEQA